MNYTEYLKKSFNYVKNHRYLWWLGLLAALTEGGGGYGASQGGGMNWPTPNQDNIKNINESDKLVQSVAHLPRVLGVSHTTSSEWMYWGIFIVVFLIVFVSLMLVIWYFSYSAKAGLIFSVQEIERDNKENSFSTAFREGKKHVWKLIGLNLLVFLAIMLLVFIFALPAMLLMGGGGSAGIVAGVIVIFFGLLALLGVGIYLSMVLRLAERYIVLKGANLSQSISEAHRNIFSRFGNVILTYLIAVGLSMAFGFVLIFATLLVGGTLFGLGYLIYKLSLVASVIYAIIAGLSLLAVLLVAKGIYVAFESSFWTLAVLQLEDKSETENA